MFFFGWAICLLSSAPDPYVSNIYQEDTDHLPGKALGEIKLMSKMTDDETLDSVRIRRFVHLRQHQRSLWTYIMHALFRWFDPYV